MISKRQLLLRALIPLFLSGAWMPAEAEVTLPLPPIPNAAIPVPPQGDDHRTADGSASEKAPIYLLLGEQRLIHVDGLARFSLGEATVRAQPLPHSKSQESKGGSDAILIKAVQIGPADLWIWKKDGSMEHRTIRVDKGGTEGSNPKFARALSQLSEVEVYTSGGGVILRGEIRSFEEAARVHALALGNPQDVHDESEPSEDLLTRAQAKLNDWLAKSTYGGKLQVQRDDRALVIRLTRGSIDSPAEKQRIEKRAQSIFAGTQLDFESLPDASPIVHFKVFLLELQKKRFGSLGLGWPASQAGAFRVTTSAIQDMLQLDLTLQALEGEGSLKILSNPELVVRAPGDAELFSGGEIPVETKSAYFSQISWKNFGLLLKLHVTNSAGDKVRLDINTEVSRIDSTLTIDKVPGIQANRMKTQVDAQYGKPLLLSGLLQQNMHKEAQGLPMLRNIPILGALFGSEDYQNEKSELVAVLVPSNELPRNPMERIVRYLPKGPIPPARHPSNPEQERIAKQSSEYPWNVLQ